MSVEKLSASTQNYLKAIWTLEEWSTDEVTPSAIAKRAGVKISSASDAVRRLADQGFVEHSPYGSVTLTDEGRGHAVAMVRRHRLIESFLVESLGYRWDQVHEEADNLEHCVSDFMIERIDAHLGHPTRDPHGDPIPRADGTVTSPDAVPLTALSPGDTGTVERVSDSDGEILQFLERNGIGVGRKLTVHPGSGQLLAVSIDGASPTTIAAVAAEAILVSTT